MKKKALLVVALAIVLALSFATIATAKYAGYAYNNPVVPSGGGAAQANAFPGYLSWGGATEIYNRNVPGGTNMTTAHGGYVSTTTKCAVCHSAHRAYSAAASTGTVPDTANLSLTSSSGCVNCHTVWGAGGSAKKIEWANVTQGLAAGPHASDNFPSGCTSKCHTGGVHGSGTSEFHGMNTFMLGNDKDAAVKAALQNGNVGFNINYSATPNAGTAANWFQYGKTPVPSTGLPPQGTSSPNFAAAKATATGYTCAQVGCHTSSQFAVNRWGYSEMHVADPRESGSPTPTMMAFTGHGTGTQTEDSYQYICGPCHPGSVAAGYRTLAYADQIKNFSSMTYGCDQCHDMIGKLTNTTAFPHGNRNIDVYQWTTAGAQETVTAASGNLWMYSADISTLDPDVIAGNTGGEDAAARVANRSWTVVKNATSWNSSTGTGNINDGVCLKCHVPIDQASIQARGGDKSIGPATDIHTAYVDEDGVFHNEDDALSGYIFLYK